MHRERTRRRCIRPTTANMKRFLIISALLLAVVFTATADRRRLMMVRNSTATSYTLKEDASGAAGAGLSMRTDTSSEVRSTTIKATASYTPTKISVWLLKTGSPTGAITVYIYNTADGGTTEGPPDDRDVTASATIDASTLTGSYVEYQFTFTGAAAWTSGKYYQIVLGWAGGTGTDSISWDAAGFVSSDWGYYSRATSPPSTPNDAANWTEVDNNGSHRFKVFSSP